MSQDLSPDREAAAAAARARAAIECAIVTLKAYRSSLTEGQIHDIKRVIYSSEPIA